MVGLVTNLYFFSPFFLFVENQQSYMTQQNLQVLLSVMVLIIILVLSYFSFSSYIFKKVLKHH